MIYSLRLVRVWMNGLSDGNEDGDNESIDIEGRFVINSTWFEKLLQTMHILQPIFFFYNSLLHHTNNRVHKQQTPAGSLRDALL